MSECLNATFYGLAQIRNVCISCFNHGALGESANWKQNLGDVLSTKTSGITNVFCLKNCVNIREIEYGP